MYLQTSSTSSFSGRGASLCNIVLLLFTFLFNFPSITTVANAHNYDDPSTLRNIRQSSQAPPIKIMPLGDSITQGAGVPGGYRKILYEILTERGYTIEFVRTKTSNRFAHDPKGTKNNHEGHGGWNIDDISSHIAEFLDRIDSPHIILLHIGINDFGKFGKDRVNAIHRWSALLTNIYRLQPHAHIIATNLMYRHGSYIDIQRLFNP